MTPGSGCALLCSRLPALKSHANHTPPRSESRWARVCTHSHVHKGETSWKINPTTSTAIGHLDCFHNFPLKYYSSRKRLTEMQSFCFYPRKCSVLFPSNKYQIKAHFPFFHLFQNGLRCIFFCARCTCVHVALSFTLKVEAGRLQLVGGPGPAGLHSRRSFLFRLSFGPQLLDPMLLLLVSMLYTLGIKTMTSI